MEINIRMIQDVTVVEMSGDIDGKTAPIVQEKIRREGLKPGAKTILDMSKVEYMSSAGLRVLLSIHRQAAASNNALKIVGISEDIKETMSMTGFLGYFNVYDTLQEALAAF